MTTITWLRHSKTLPATEGQPDATRSLSQEGMELALERRKRLDFPMFDMVIDSGRRRTEQTGRIVAGLPQDNASITVPQLAWNDGDSIGDMIASVYREIDNASLDAYMSRVPKELTALAKMAALAIHHHVFNKPSNARPRNVLVIGHAVMTSAVCDATGHHFDFSRLRSSVLGECEGYVVQYGEFADWRNFELVN